MGNSIHKRQNEKHCIPMLAAQRQLYIEARNAQRFISFFAVILPFILSVAQFFVSSNPLLNTAVYAGSVISLFIGLLAGKYTRGKKQMAAAIQQEFDIYVYRMHWDEQFFGPRVNLDADIAEKASRFLSHPARKKELYNWYVGIKSNIPYEDAILFCQKQNVRWDGQLRKRYRNACILLFIAISIIMLGLGVYQDESLREFIKRLAFLAPMLYWILEAVSALNSDIQRLYSLQHDMSDNLPVNMNRLLRIQKGLLEHRSNCRFIPQWFYRFFRRHDSLIAQSIADWMESGNS